MTRAFRKIAQACPPLYRQMKRMRQIRLHEPNLWINCRVLGSGYGGWGVPEGFLGAQSIVYSAGVGEDISFDLGLVEAYGCEVLALDPTPISVSFMATVARPAKLTFLPVGLAAADGTEEFFAPKQAGHCSFSQTADANEGESHAVSCEVLTVASLMQRQGHTRLDLLKMDIEGFEYAVIGQMLASGTKPRCLLVEFHHLMYGIETDRTLAAVEQLRAAGYRIFWMSALGREYGFLLNT